MKCRNRGDSFFFFLSFSVIGALVRVTTTNITQLTRIASIGVVHARLKSSVNDTNAQRATNTTCVSRVRTRELTLITTCFS